MKKKLSINSVIVLSIVFFVFLTISFFAQKKKVIEKNENDPKQIKKVNKSSGWDIPTIDEKELINTKQAEIDNQIVLLKGYKLQRHIYMQLDFYSLNTDNSLNTHSSEVEVKTIASYSINNKVFGYRLNTAPFSTNETGERISIPAVITLFYSDEDGDGKFETRYLGSDPQIKVPDWAIITSKRLINK